jgi:FkbM family methyltransferase
MKNNELVDISAHAAPPRFERPRKNRWLRSAIACGLNAVLRLVARAPGSGVLLAAAPARRNINVLVPKSRAARILGDLLAFLLCEIARVRRSRRERYADVSFRLGDQSWRAMLDVHEYTQCAYYCGHLNESLLRLLQKGGGVFIDVGANVGVYSIAASRFFKSVIAFEPDPRSLPQLQRNVSMSSADNVRVVPLALSDRKSEAQLYFDPSNKGGSSLVSCAAGDAAVSVGAEISTIPLDDFLEGERTDRIALVKIDVEGHEAGVLRGAQRMLYRDAPVLFVEVWTREQAQQLLSLLPPNYRAYHPVAGILLENWDGSGDLIDVLYVAH